MTWFRLLRLQSDRYESGLPPIQLNVPRYRFVRLVHRIAMSDPTPEQVPFAEPPVLEPPPVLNPHQPRNIAGWVGLVLLFGLMMTSAIAGSLGQNPLKKTTPEQIDAELRTAMLPDRLVGAFKQSGTVMPRDTVLLRKLRKKIEPQKAKSEEFAAISLVIDKELGQPSDPDALNLLKESKKPDIKLLAAYYSGTKLSAQEANAFKATKDGPYWREVARNQMLTGSGSAEVKKDVSAATTFVFLVLLVLCGLGIGCIAIGIYVWGLASGKIVPKGFTIGQLTDRVADRLAFRMAFYLTVFLAVQVLVLLAPSSLGLSKWPWAQAAMMVVTFVLVVASLRIRFQGVGDSYKRLVGDLKNWPSHVGVGFLAATANIPMVLAVSMLVNPLTKNLPQPTHPIQKELASGSMVVIAAAFVSASLLAPLLEELTFRGMLAPALSRLLKSPTAGVLASGFLFAAIHPQGLAGIPMLMVIGCTAAAATRLTGSLLPAMVMHFLNNTAVLLLSLAMNAI